MLLALCFAAAGFTLGVVLTALSASHVFGLVRDDMARQLEGYDATFLFASPAAARHGNDLKQGRTP